MENENNVVRKLWHYEKVDPKGKNRSWKYIDFIIKNNKIIWVKNPYFAYEHFSPFSRQDIKGDNK